MKFFYSICVWLICNILWAQPTTVKVALDWYINPDHAPLLVAQTYGYFAAQGLNVEFIEPTSTTSARNLVLTHQADIGIDYQPETLLAINQGMPIKVFANLIPTPLQCMAVLVESPIENIADLRGKTLGYSGNPLEASLINTELKHAGIDPNSVQLVAVNMNLSQVLLSGKVAAVNGLMRNVEPIALKEQGITTRLFYPERNGVPTYAELVLITDPSTVNKATLQKFMNALNQGVVTLKAHPLDAWNKVAAAYPQELASSQAIASVNELIWIATFSYFTKEMTQISVSDYQAYNNFLLKNGLIKQAIPLSQYWLSLN
jgi:putative hydroxymethylpyrimidine transport system substrate-binding protein